MPKILLAEDEGSVRQGIAELLEFMGYTVIQCSNGRRALDTLLDNNDIDLVITDFKMPIMDGRELVDRIRSKKGFADLPIIIISGVVGPKEIAGALERGATAFLAKPVKSAELKEYIERYLD